MNTFHRVLNDHADFKKNDLIKLAEDKKIKKAVICSGKIYFDLIQGREKNKNKLNNEPYVKDAIFKPIIIKGSFGSLKYSAVKIRIIVQKTETTCEFLIEFNFGNQSLIVDEESELIDELNVDIATDRIPATTIPFIPFGNIL